MNLKLSMDWLTRKSKGSACLGHITGLGSETTAPGFLRGKGISSQGLRLPKQALSLPSSPSTPGFPWPWRMFPMLLFLPCGSRSHSSPALLQRVGHLHLLPVLCRPSWGPTPSPFSLKGLLELFFCYQRVRRTSLFPPRKLLHLNLWVY